MAIAQRYGAGHRILVTGGAGFVGSHLCRRTAGPRCDRRRRRQLRHRQQGERRPPGRGAEVHAGRGGRRASRCRPIRARGAVRRDPALRVAGQPDRLHHPAAGDPAGRLARHVAPAGPGGRRRRPVPAGVDLGGVRRPAGPPAAGELLGQRQPDRHPQRLRRGKRFGEAATMAYRRYRGADVGIVRIFNTYGPRMRPDDGRAIPNFITQALRGERLTVHGTGEQTRSICYVGDLRRSWPFRSSTGGTRGTRAPVLGALTTSALHENVLETPTIGRRVRTSVDPAERAPGSHTGQRMSR